MISNSNSNSLYLACHMFFPLILADDVVTCLKLRREKVESALNKSRRTLSLSECNPYKWQIVHDKTPNLKCQDKFKDDNWLSQNYDSMELSNKMITTIMTVGFLVLEIRLADFYHLFG